MNAVINGTRITAACAATTLNSPSQSQPLLGARRTQPRRYRYLSSYQTYFSASRHYVPPFSTIGGVLSWVCILNVFTASCIFVGSFFLHDCGEEPELPIMLILLGVGCALMSLVDGYIRVRAIQNRIFVNDHDRCSFVKVLNYIIKWYLLALTMSGCIIVFHIHHNLNLYKCNHVLVIFSLYAYTIMLVMYAVFTFLCLSCFCDEFLVLDCC